LFAWAVEKSDGLRYPKGVDVVAMVAVPVGDPVVVSLGGGGVCVGCSVAVGSEVLVGLAVRSAANRSAASTWAVALICSELGEAVHAVSSVTSTRNPIGLPARVMGFYWFQKNFPNEFWASRILP
jgi:hypothetical protein